MNRQRVIWVTTVLTLLAVTSAWSQGYRSRYSIHQNKPPATELVVARLKFGTNGYIGHRGWSHNYPASDQNFNEFIRRSTGIDVEQMSYLVVELSSDEIFDYPFVYVSEPGEMELSAREVTNLREYIRRGGFILMDDFDGAIQIATMKSQVYRAFPGQMFDEIEIGHIFFNIHFQLDNLNGMAPYVPGGQISYHGIDNEKGDIAIAAGYNNDLANFWEWYYLGEMPLKPATDAFRLGVNAVVYSMTH
jgi:hypothetical protein